MKTFKLTSKIFLLALLVFSCSEKDPEYGGYDFAADSFIAFAKETESVNELAADPIDLTANYAIAGSSIPNTSIAFTITSDNAVEGVDYMVVGNKTSFDFTSGDLTDIVQIMPIDNLIEDGNKTLTITLASTGFPGPDGNNKSMTLTIVDNDCAFTLQELGDASWSGSDNASGTEGPNDTQITMAYDGTTFSIEGIAYGWLTNTGFWDEIVVTSTPVIANIDIVTGVLTVAQQPLCITTWNGDIQPDYEVAATGSYDSCSQTMTINYDLYQNAAILRSYTETLTK